jgi:hypothetical protein
VTSREDYDLFEYVLSSGANPEKKNNAARSVVDLANEIENEKLHAIIRKHLS